MRRRSIALEISLRWQRLEASWVGNAGTAAALGFGLSDPRAYVSAARAIPATLGMARNSTQPSTYASEMVKETSDSALGTPMRQWQSVPEASTANPTGEPVRFTLMTYNVSQATILYADREIGHCSNLEYWSKYQSILTPSLATQDQFPRSTPKALDRNRRRKRVVEEIAHHRPDIICLQEMDERTEFRRFYRNQLTRLNYKCHFRPPREKTHGCCIAWNQAEWCLVDAVAIPLNRRNRVQGLVDWYLKTTGKSLDELSIAPARIAMVQRLGKPWRSMRANSAALSILHRLSASEKRWCARRAVEASQRRQLGALMDMFEGMTIDGPDSLHEQNYAASPTDALPESEPNLDDNNIIVVTCHLHWHPEAQFERLLQALYILRNVQAFNAGTCYPVLFAGDFNTIPLDPLYKALVNRPLNVSDVDQLVCSMEFYAAMQLNTCDAVPSQLNSSIDYIPDEAKRNYVQGLIDQLKALGHFNSAYDQPKLHPSICLTSLTACNEPPYTTYCEFVNTLDYIFYSANPSDCNALPKPFGDLPAVLSATLTSHRTQSQGNVGTETDVATWWTKCHVRRILEIPPRSALEPGIPNAHYPSDHLCLLAELEVSRALIPEQYIEAVCADGKDA
ncbi:RNA exonuclease ngl2 [Dimargaris verticillata]|uniref:RNA exonuclease ngl2 n=1 Tax=Dimargaris verticillata TaxID=2761393 RepID=A0A9W8B6T2_9FUNG|nr:RNA exonuclease ngl2 [Dimargaris verticillata]